MTPRLERVCDLFDLLEAQPSQNDAGEELRKELEVPVTDEKSVHSLHVLLQVLNQSYFNLVIFNSANFNSNQRTSIPHLSTVCEFSTQVNQSMIQ